MYGMNYPYYSPQGMNPYQNRLNAMQAEMTPRQEIVRVNGRNGAEAFNLPPNSSVILLDETAPIIWLKMTDGAGYPTLNPYTITPYQPETPVDTKSLEARVARLEELLNEKSDSKPAKPSRSGKTTDTDE